MISSCHYLHRQSWLRAHVIQVHNFPPSTHHPNPHQWTACYFHEAAEDASPSHAFDLEGTARLATSFFCVYRSALFFLCSNPGIEHRDCALPLCYWDWRRRFGELSSPTLSCWASQHEHHGIRHDIYCFIPAKDPRDVNTAIQAPCPLPTNPVLSSSLIHRAFCHWRSAVVLLEIPTTVGHSQRGKKKCGNLSVSFSFCSSFLNDWQVSSANSSKVSENGILCLF